MAQTKATKTQILIQSGRFVPNTATIKSGESVEFVNKDAVSRSVAFADAAPTEAPQKPAAAGPIEVDITKLGVGGDSSLPPEKRTPPVPKAPLPVTGPLTAIEALGTFEKSFDKAGSFTFTNEDKSSTGIVIVTA